jgi:MFS family permease
MGMPAAEPEGATGSQEPLRITAFWRFWSAMTVGGFGVAITMVAIEVFIINVLEATEAEVGFIRAVQFLPYLLVGLIAGAFVDRWRKKWTLVWTNLGRGSLLLLIPVLWLTDHLTLPVVAAVLFGVGAFGVFAVAAEQSYLPDLVPRSSLVAANARLGQSTTVAQTSGPVVGGGLVGWIGAPFAIVVNAASYFITAFLILLVRVDEKQEERSEITSIWRDIADGLRFTYRHPTLAPMAISTHVWFIAHSAALVIFALFALRFLELSPFVYGAVLALAGVGGLVGALAAPWFGRTLGEGSAVILGTVLSPVAWLIIVAVPDHGVWPIVLIAIAQTLYGFGMGMQDPNEMGYRQAVTPREMLGRMNATIRSANRSMALIGSLLGGILAGVLGYRETLLLVVAVYVAAVAIIVLSPVRGVRAG